MKPTPLFLRESTHVGCPLAFKFLAAWEGHLNNGWIPDFSPVSVHPPCGLFSLCLPVLTRKFPVSWGRLSQYIKIGLDTGKRPLSLNA